MMAFLDDPRIRQRWNQITHNAEVATENAAANLWTFQQECINPCLASLSKHVDQCTSICLGDREERARRQRERERERAEYSFDFYDDWARDEGYQGYNGGVSSFLGRWTNDDWDRLLAGSGVTKRFGDGVVDQPPRKKRGMSYGTHLRSTEQDPTVIPSTQPIGFLGRLPWKIGGTLRYKPSAADLQDHPFHPSRGERQALLDHSEDEYFQGTEQPIHHRTRRNTTGSRATSGSYRSRGDLLPSDGEGDEDAVPLGDEFTVDFDQSDDRSSNRTRSSKGKYPAGERISRTISRSTVSSGYSTMSPRPPHAGPSSLASTPEAASGMRSLEDLRQEEERLQREEEGEIEAKRRAAQQLAQDQGLADGKRECLTVSPRGRRSKPEIAEDAIYISTSQAKMPKIISSSGRQLVYMEAKVEGTPTGRTDVTASQLYLTSKKSEIKSTSNPVSAEDPNEKRESKQRSRVASPAPQSPHDQNPTSKPARVASPSPKPPQSNATKKSRKDQKKQDHVASPSPKSPISSIKDSKYKHKERVKSPAPKGIEEVMTEATKDIKPQDRVSSSRPQSVIVLASERTVKTQDKRRVASPRPELRVKHEAQVENKDSEMEVNSVSQQAADNIVGLKPQEQISSSRPKLVVVQDKREKSVFVPARLPRFD